ncbi:hypothetical protein PHLCEN_2v7251 [Hermanssonia centrifuga]|uniref:Integrase zinc-binding domain-containing protein n=1 Tax=Hermanssonia centrifuga TaxID=98765 RepID=A0A2R6NX78_9APHY|nr:hypothetical protein PHLCEN_2v7251 [Hermanssonia centrifuga]
MSTRMKRQERRRSKLAGSKLGPAQPPRAQRRATDASEERTRPQRDSEMEESSEGKENIKALPRLSRHFKDLGLPSPEEYARVQEEYIQSLSIRKKDKALLTQEMFDDIWDVLLDPHNAKLRTPQFRFWVRKMFVLSYADQDSEEDNAGETDLKPIILHEDRPVAVKPQIYDIIAYCHQLSSHGGRDKTMALVRKHYSWIPKEVVAQFIKICPTCIFKHSKEGAQHRKSMKQSTLAGLTRATGQADSVDAATCTWISMSLIPCEEALPQPAQSLRTLPLMKPRLASRILSIPQTLVYPSQSSIPLASGCLSASRSHTSHESNSGGWLSSLMSQPGPSNNDSFSPMRRTGSENDADFFRTPATRINLPPLMKALSEGMSVPSILRPQANVPSSLQIPGYHQTWGGLLTMPEDADLYDQDGSTEGSQQDCSMKIDPLLLANEYRVAPNHWQETADKSLSSFGTLRSIYSMSMLSAHPTPIKSPRRVLIPAYTNSSHSTHQLNLPLDMRMIILQERQGRHVALDHCLLSDPRQNLSGTKCDSPGADL